MQTALAIIAIVVSGLSAAFVFLQARHQRDAALATERAAAAAERSAGAAQASTEAAARIVDETAKARFDDMGPRVVCVSPAGGWPPLVYRGSANHPLRDLHGATPIADTDRFSVENDGAATIFMHASAMLRNEGRGSGRVTFNAPVNVTASANPAVGISDNPIGAAAMPPGSDLAFSFTLGRTVEAWIEAPPPGELAHLEIGVADTQADGTVDKIWLSTNLNPLMPTPGMPAGVYQLNVTSLHDVGIETSPRQYRALGYKPFDPPWRSRHT